MANGTFKQDLICRFCGGRACKYEDWTKQTTPPALRGLHSSWLTPDIIGMQRPSNRLCNSFNIVQQFREQSIGAIFNLQERGEHSQCGDGIEEGGFSYSPALFMDAGIYFYNFGWVDMTAPDVEYALSICKVIAFHIRERKDKIAIHCHAGLGRTGLVAACWLIYGLNMAPSAAIDVIRSKRPGSIKNSSQVQIVKEFATYLLKIRNVFPTDDIPAAASLDAFVLRQRTYLRGNESRRLRFVPKILHRIVKRIIQLVDNGMSEKIIADAFTNPRFAWSVDHDQAYHRIVCEVNEDKWERILCADIYLLAQMMLDWLEALQSPLFGPDACRLTLEDSTNVSIILQLSPITFVTLGCIIRCLQLVLPGMDPDSRIKFCKRFAASLAHLRTVSPTDALCRWSILGPVPLERSFEPDQSSNSPNDLSFAALGRLLNLVVMRWEEIKELYTDEHARRDLAHWRTKSIGLSERFGPFQEDVAIANIVEKFTQLSAQKQTQLIASLQRIHKDYMPPSTDEIGNAASGEKQSV